MAKFRALWLVALAGIALLVPQSRAAASTNLVFDAITKEYNAKVGERTAEFDFSVTNTGPTEVTINTVRASCGCTTPKLPTLPWKLEPGKSGSFHVTTDLAGKFGTFQKSIFMDTTDGPKLVYVKITVPTAANAAAGMANVDARTRAMQIAHADPQAIFRGECANCHSKPGLGKKGEELYTADCAICHESNQRAVLVTDLHALKQTPNEAFWDAWIRNGKVATMMPAFALEKQGPLSNEQIESLVAYLMSDEFKTRKPHYNGPSMTSAQPIAQVTTLPPRTVTPHIPLPGSEPLLPAVPSTQNAAAHHDAPPTPAATPNK
jgi:mono/diheme cytochrome c family protein